MNHSHHHESFLEKRINVRYFDIQLHLRQTIIINMTRDAGTYGARGAIAPLPFLVGARGAKVPFSKNITLTKSKYFKKR